MKPSLSEAHLNGDPAFFRPTELQDDLGVLTVNEGISQNQIQQLIAYANTDEKVRKFSSDPKRFKDVAAFEEWLKKGRTIYTMTDASGELLGIIWYGPEGLPQKKFIREVENPEHYGTTFAIRVYDKARGKHLARKFMAAAQTAFENSPAYKLNQAPGVWLETFAENSAAVTSYEAFGYERITDPDDHGRILMIYKES